jgi:acyl carrier protein
MKDKIKEIMSLVFSIPADSIKDDASTQNLENWDSLNHMNLVVALEQEFQIRFEDDEIIKIVSFNEVANNVTAKLGTKNI